MKLTHVVALVATVVGCDDGPRPGRIDLLTSECDEPGRACTWLGLPGEEGFNGDGEHRLLTRIYWGFDLMFASDGTPWFIDWNNHLVRRVLADDKVETVLGWIDPIFPGDGGPGERTEEGAMGTEVQLNHPTDLAEAPDGTILVMAWHNHKLRKLDPATGRVKIVCGAGAGFAGDGMDASLALFRQPKALGQDEQGNTYILDQQNFRIRRIDQAGVISTIAGNGTRGFGGDGGLATGAMLNFEAGSNPEPSGGMVIADGKLYLSDTLNERVRVIDLESGIIDTLAGDGVEGFAGDGGPARQAHLSKPRDLEIGPDGDLYVADTDNSRIRAIDLQRGTIRTVAGNGRLGLDAEEALPALQLSLRRPFGIEFDRDGNLYIADTLNSRIVKVAR